MNAQAQRLGALADAPGAWLRALPAAVGRRVPGRTHPGRRSTAQCGQHAGRGVAATHEHDAVAAAADNKRGRSQLGGGCALRNCTSVVKAHQAVTLLRTTTFDNGLAVCCKG